MPAEKKIMRPTEDSYEKDYRNSYISGNVVPKPLEQPVEAPSSEEKRARKKELWEADAPLYELHKGIDFVTMVMLCAALLVCAYTAIGYLSISSKCVELDKQITQLTSEYETISGANDNRLDAIVANTDFNEIYNYAVGKLGMVYPNENRVIYFDYSEDGYVRQYAEIPELDEDDTLKMENILNRLFQKQ